MGDEDVQDETDIEMSDPSLAPNLPTATVIHSNLTVSSPGFQIPSSQTSTLGGVLSQSQHCTLPLPLSQTTSTGLATTMQFCSVHYLAGLIGVAKGCQGPSIFGIDWKVRMNKQTFKVFVSFLSAKDPASRIAHLTRFAIS